MYLMHPTVRETSQSSLASPPTAQGLFSSTKIPKLLSVSPFMDRAGHYSALVTDPQSAILSPENKALEMTVSLSDPSFDPPRQKMQAKVYSTAVPISADDMAEWSSLGFAKWVIRYGWVGLLVFPRILRQAWSLWTWKKLKIYVRPEVTGGSVCQRPNGLERFAPTS